MIDTIPAPALDAEYSTSNTPGPGWSGQMLLAWIDDDAENERGELTDADLAEHLETMPTKGQLEPATVYQVGPCRYRLQSGHRRRASAHRLGWVSLWVVVVEPPADWKDQTFKRLLANIGRKDIDPILFARSLKKLYDDGMTQTAIGKELGIDQSRVANALRLLELPEEVQAMVSGKKLSPGHAEQLLRLKEEMSWQGAVVADTDAVRRKYAEQTAAHGWSVKDLRENVGTFLRNHTAAKEYTARQAKEEAGRAERERKLEEERQRREAAEELRKDRRAMAGDALSWAMAVDPEGPSLDHLRLVVLALAATVGGAFGCAPDPAEVIAQVDAAEDERTLLTMAARLAAQVVKVRYDGDGATCNPTWLEKWIEARFGPDAAIQHALTGAGLLEAPAPQKQDEAA